MVSIYHIDSFLNYDSDYFAKKCFFGCLQLFVGVNKILIYRDKNELS